MWGCEGEEVERGVYVPYTTEMSGGVQKGTEVKEFTHLQRSEAHRDCSAPTSALRIRVMRTEPSKVPKQLDDVERMLCAIHSHQAARPKQYGEFRGVCVAVRLSERQGRDKSERTTVLDGADAIPRADRTASFLCLLDLPLDVPRLVSSNDDADGIATETSPALIAAPGTCGSLLIVRTAPYTSGCTAVQPYQRRDARNRTSMWSSPEWVEQGTVRKNMTVKPLPPLSISLAHKHTHTRDLPAETACGGG